METLSPDVGAIADISAQELEQLWLWIDTTNTTASNSSAEEGPIAVADDDDDDVGNKKVASSLVRKKKTTTTKSANASSANANSSALSPAELELRRKRNSASMRRASQRKKLKFQHLRQQVALLEKKLEELKCVTDETRTAEAADAADAIDAAELELAIALALSPPSSSHRNHPRAHRRTEQDVQELLLLIKNFQHEQLCLHNAIQRHEQLAGTLSQLLDKSKSLVFANTSIYSGMRQSDEDFLWVNTVLPFLPVFSKSEVDDLVRESYLEISRYFATAEALSPSTDHVLEWSNKRSLANGWVEFVFSKDFPDEDIEGLAAKSWDNFTSTDRSLKPKEATYKVLERLDDNTLIMAKNLRCDAENRSYHSIFVVLRVRTASGYIIGNRTISPLPQYERRFMEALGGSRPYLLQFYGVSLSRHSEDSTRGCSVKMGGHVGNGTPLLAQILMTTGVFILLSWENHCVKPVQLLRSFE